MDTKLYVGNLPYSITDDQLGELFAQFGTVSSAMVISDRNSGRSKGFGFVEFATKEEADKAIEGLHGKDYEGRNLVVNVARPKEPRRDFGGGAGGGQRGSY